MHFWHKILPESGIAVAVRTRVCDCTHSTVTACLADQRAQDFCVTMDRGSQPTTSSANSQRIYNLMFEQFAQVLTLPDLSQFRFVFSGHYELAAFILDWSTLEISSKW